MTLNSLLPRVRADRLRPRNLRWRRTPRRERPRLTSATISRSETVLAANQNKVNGNRFEQELSHRLAMAGWWVHVLQQNKAGQPADIIAVNKRETVLIDCKVISDNRGFPFSRVEENQRLAMTRFRVRTGGRCYFALKLPDGSIRMLGMQRIEQLETAGAGSVGMRDMEHYTLSLDEWLGWAELMQGTGGERK